MVYLFPSTSGWVFWNNLVFRVLSQLHPRRGAHHHGNRKKRREICNTVCGHCTRGKGQWRFAKGAFQRLSLMSSSSWKKGHMSNHAYYMCSFYRDGSNGGLCSATTVSNCITWTYSMTLFQKCSVLQTDNTRVVCYTVVLLNQLMSTTLTYKNVDATIA